MVCSAACRILGGKLCHSSFKIAHFLSIVNDKDCPFLHIRGEQHIQQSLPPKIRQAAEQTIQEAAPPRSIEEVKAMLESTEKGSVRNSIRNCLTVFQNDPLLSGAIAKNLLTERVDIVKPIGYHRIGTAITDTDMNYLLLYLVGVGSQKVAQAIADTLLPIP